LTPVKADEAERLQRLAALRDQVFECDRELVRQVGLRTALIREIDEIKTELGLPIRDPERDAAVVKRALGMTGEYGAEGSLIHDLMWRLMGERESAMGGLGSAEDPATT